MDNCQLYDELLDVTGYHFIIAAFSPQVEVMDYDPIHNLTRKLGTSEIPVFFKPFIISDVDGLLRKFGYAVNNEVDTYSTCKLPDLVDIKVMTATQYERLLFITNGTPGYI